MKVDAGVASHVVLLARVGEEVGLAVGHLIVRTIYTPSELKSMRIMRDNSGIISSSMRRGMPLSGVSRVILLYSLLLLML